VSADLAAAARGEAVAVTSENFEALLLASAAQAAAIAKGEAVPARKYALERTDRDTAVAAPRRFTKDDVQALRLKFRMSQAVFAKLVGVSAKLEQAWEIGARVPSGPAARVLEMLERSPAAARGLVRAKTTAAKAKGTKVSAAKTITATGAGRPARGTPPRRSVRA
jgi:putative transcriptional regulator